MRGVEGSAPMNAMTLAELIVIDPYFADCVLPLVHVGASLNHLGKKRGARVLSNLILVDYPTVHRA